MIAGAFALSTSAQTTEKRGDNGGVISVEASEDLTCVPVTFALNNPTAAVVTGQAVFDAPAGAKFTENADEEMVTANDERAGSKKAKGSWNVMEKFDAANPSHIEVAFLSMSNPKVALAGTEGVVFTVYIDASALSDGEYEVKMTNVVVEDFDFETPKTKDGVALLNNLKVEGKKTLIVLPEVKKNVNLSVRNIQRVEVMTASALNTYKVMNANVLVVTENALKLVDETFNK